MPSPNFDFSHFTKADLTKDFIKSFFFNENNQLLTKRTAKDFLIRIGLYHLLKTYYDKPYSIIETIYRILGDESAIVNLKKNYKIVFNGSIPKTKDEVTDEFLENFFVKSNANHQRMMSKTFYEINNMEDLYELLMSCCLKNETLPMFVNRRLNKSSESINVIFNPSKMTIDEYVDTVLTDKDGKYIKNRICEKYLKSHNAYEAIMGYYDDCDSLQEFFYRYRNKINVKPVCPVCGNPVNLTVNKDNMSLHFATYCSKKCYHEHKEKGKRSSPFSKLSQKQVNSLTLDDLKIMGVYSEDGEHNFRKMTDKNLKKHGLYDVATKILEQESKKEEDLTMPQLAYKIIYGDYKRCVVCDKPVKLRSSGIWATTCSLKCAGKKNANIYKYEEPYIAVEDRKKVEEFLNLFIENENKL